ncbi:MAG: protoporphyrinogen oxidase HemJ [Betaproteobacteria bacterium]
MLWIKSFHIVFMVAWFAGLFYLPRLFVYHVQAEDRISMERFKIMERKLYFGIMTPCMILTVVLGLWLWLGWWNNPAQAMGWLHAKLVLVLILVAHHFYLGKLMVDFKRDRNRHGHVFYRWLNEIPTLPALIGIVILVVVKPF